MAVAFDASGTTGLVSSNYGTAAQTYSHTVGASATAVILGISCVGSGSAAWSAHAPTVVTFGGTTMNLLGYQGANNVVNATGFVALYGLLNPPTGTQAVNITMGASATFWWAQSVSYTGAGSIGGAVKACSGAAATAASASLAGSNFGSSTAVSTGTVQSNATQGSMMATIMGVNQVQATTLTGPTSVTSRFNDTGTAHHNSGYIADAPIAAATGTFGFTAGGTAAWGAVAVNLNPPNVVCFDSLGGGVLGTSHASSPITWVHNVSYDANTAVVVGFNINTTSNTWATLAPSAVTFGGQAMTPVYVENGVNNASPTTGYVALYYLLNPTNRGAQTVSISFPPTQFSGANSLSYTGVASAAAGVTNGGSSTNPTTGAVTSAASHMVVSQLGTVNVVVSAPTKTPRYSSSSSTSGFTSLSGYLQDAVGAATVTTAMTAATALWATVSIDLVNTAASQSRSAALTGHGVLSATATAKFSETAALSGRGVLSATAAATKFTLTSTLSGHGVLTTAATAKFSETAALSGHGVLSATATAKFSETASLTGTGTLAATAAATKFVLTASLAGHGVLSAVAYAKFSVSATLAGRGSLSASATAKFSETASLNGHGTLAATASATKFTLAATLSAQGVLAATAAAKYLRAATLAGNGVLAATATAKYTIAAILAGQGVLSAAARMYEESIAALLPGQGALSATAVAQYLRPTPLPGIGILTGPGTAVYSRTANLTGIGTLTGTTSAICTSTPALPGHGVLAAAIRINIAATLRGHGVLTAANMPNIPAVLPGVGVLAATTYAKFVTAPSVEGFGVLSATAESEFTRAPSLTGAGALSATAAATQFTLAATLSGHGVLTAAASSSGTRNAALTGHGVLVAAAAATQFILPATLSGHGVLTANAYPEFSLNPTLAAAGALTANAAPKFSVECALPGHGALTASATATAAGFVGNGTLSAIVLAVDVTVVSGQLEIVCTDDYLTLQSEDPYDLTGSFVHAECIQTPNVSDGSTEALLYVYEAPAAGDGYIVQIGYFDGNFVCEDNGGSGTTMTTRYTTTFDLAVHTWWRIHESDGTVYWDYSADSLNWTNATSRAISPVSDLYVGFISGCNVDAPSPGIAVWDNFNVFTVPAGPSGNGQLSATVNVVTRPAALPSYGTLTAILQPAIQAALPGNGVLDAAARMYSLHEACQLAGTGTLTGTAAAITCSPTLHGHGTLTAAVQQAVTGAFSGHGALTSRPPGTASPELSGLGHLTATASEIIPADVSPQLSGHGTLSAQALGTEFVLPATLAGSGTLSSTAIPITRSATLSGHGDLSAAAYAKFTLPAVLPGNGALTSTAALPAHAHLSSHGALSALMATGPKTDTLYDAFSRKNLTKWTGWSTDSLSIVYEATYDAPPRLSSYAALSVVVSQPPPLSRNTKVEGTGRIVTAGGTQHVITVPAVHGRTVTAPSNDRTTETNVAGTRRIVTAEGTQRVITVAANQDVTAPTDDRTTETNSTDRAVRATR